MSEGAQKKQEKARKFQAIRGTRDLLPPDTALWNRVEQTAREVFATFGFGEIRPPVFEATELFARSIGEETDVVAKELYAFMDAPDISHLEQDRDAVKEVNPGIAAVGKQEIFELYLYNLITDIDTAIASTKLRLSAKAQSDLDILKARFGELVALPDSKDDDTNNRRRLLTLEIIIKLDFLKFGEPVVLRPEATASVCRAYIEHNMQQWPQPVKLYYIGPMFRRERPQKGRYRQFYQIGAEVLERVASGGKEVASGEWRVASEDAKQRTASAGKDAARELLKDAAVDAEVIEMLMTFFERCGLRNTTLNVNSIGHRAPSVDGKEVCRRGYVAKLREELTKVKDQLGADSQRRMETNPLRVLDSKLEHEQAIIAKLPRIGDHLCEECKTHYAELKRQLDLRGVTYNENWRLVRGLDYYMRTTFEITARGLGSQDAVCGGGRYDGLVELLGGPPTKGIGFAIGEDRLTLSLQEQSKEAESGGKEVASGEWRVASLRTGVDVYVTWMGEKAYATALRAAKTLRGAGFRVDMPAAELKFGKALERASKLKARFALILGDDEVASGQWTLKNLADSSQQKLTEAALLEYLRRP